MPLGPPVPTALNVTTDMPRLLSSNALEFQRKLNTSYL